MLEKLFEILKEDWYGVSIFKKTNGNYGAVVDFGNYGIYEYEYNKDTQSWEILPKSEEK